jgi:hypothetical protein
MNGVRGTALALVGLSSTICILHACGNLVGAPDESQGDDASGSNDGEPADGVSPAGDGGTFDAADVFDARDPNCLSLDHFSKGSTSGASVTVSASEVVVDYPAAGGGTESASAVLALQLAPGMKRTVFTFAVETTSPDAAAWGSGSLARLASVLNGTNADTQEYVELTLSTANDLELNIWPQGASKGMYERNIPGPPFPYGGATNVTLDVVWGSSNGHVIATATDGGSQLVLDPVTNAPPSVENMLTITLGGGTIAATPAIHLRFTRVCIFASAS